MGLLDGILGSSIEDPKTQATMAAIQGLLGGRGALQGVSGGLLAYGNSMAQAKQQQAQQQLQALQLQQHQVTLEQAKAAAEKQKQLQALAQQYSQSPVQVATGIGKGPTFASAEALKTAQPGFDFNGYAKALASIDPMASLQLQASMKKEQPKLSKMEPMRGPDGQLVNVAVFDDGTTKILPYGVKPEMVFQDIGGSVAAVDKNSIQNGTLLRKSMTPDAVASNSLGRARLNFDIGQANSGVTWQQDADGNFVGLPTKLNGGNPVRAVPAVAPNGMAPLQGKGAGMTEDQAKATGWLVQAENAHKNMLEAMKSTPGAERPGFNDALAKVPSMGLTSGLANVLRGDDRQKFMQAASSLSESLLRAATGAGVNKDEAEQKVREITPQIGDGDAVVKQKLAAIPLYIESLKVRAGPGARKAAPIINGGGASDDPFGIRGGGGDPNDPFGIRQIINPKG